jgi:hypothetical protein
VDLEDGLAFEGLTHVALRATAPGQDETAVECHAFNTARPSGNFRGLQYGLSPTPIDKAHGRSASATRHQIVVNDDIEPAD